MKNDTQNKYSNMEVVLKMYSKLSKNLKSNVLRDLEKKTQMTLNHIKLLLTGSRNIQEQHIEIITETVKKAHLEEANKLYERYIDYITN